MPELPDLEYLVKRLSPLLAGRRIESAVVREPIVLRVLVPGSSFAEALAGRTFAGLDRHGPFLRFHLDAERKLVIHHMLSGRLQHAGPSDKPLPHLCFSLDLDDGSSLRYGDDKRMGRVYVTPAKNQGAIPGWDSQGLDILSPEFTLERFAALIADRREQARVFLMDQSALSAIGNAYADEILFDAGVHPKTPCDSLSAEERLRLYDSVRSVIAWGIAEVEKAARPTEEKVRGHLKVRGRLGEPCPRCGTTIRRAGVRGYDAFFCPKCQMQRGRYSRRGSIPWR